MTKSFGAVAAVAGRELRLARRGGPRTGRRERRRQVHDRQDARRACTGPTTARCSWTARRSSSAGPADAKAAGIAVIYQEPTLFPDLSRRGEHRDGPPPAHEPRPDRPCGDAAPKPNGSSPASASGIDPARPARGLSIADQQIVEIAKALSAPRPASLVMDEPTAALSRRRGRAALHGRPDAARRGRRDHVHLPPLRGDHRALRARDDHARRTARLHRRGRRRHRRRDGAADGRPRPGRAVPQAGRRTRRGRAGSRRPRPGKACSATSPSPCAPGRSSRSPGWSGPAAPRSSRPSSASTRATRGSCASAARRSSRTRRGPRWPPGWPWSPRTGGSRA